MKKYLNIFRNWRIHMLTVLAFFAFIFIAGECDGITVLLLTKGMGVCLVYIIYRLIRYWNGKGQINELKEFIED